jgi:hypothetical protein
MDTSATNGRDENAPIIAAGTLGVLTLGDAEVRRSEDLQFGRNERASRGVRPLDGVASRDNTADPFRWRTSPR